LDILINFRIWKIGIIFDIEKAFHRIQLHKEDREFTRFLWLSDPTDPAYGFDIFRSSVVSFGAKPSPIILNSVLHLHFKKFLSWVAADILRYVYVENLSSGRDSKAKAQQYYDDSFASLHLKSWGFQRCIAGHKSRRQWNRRFNKDS